VWAAGIFGERRRAERGQQRFPDEVQHALHVADAGGDGDDHVLIGHDDAVLAEGAVAAVGVVPAAPELITVALFPVCVFVARVVAVRARGFGDPGGGNDLAAVPFPILQIELAEVSDVLGRDVEAPAADVDAARIAVPDRIGDAERIEEARAEVFADAHACASLHAGGEHIGGAAVVDEVRAGRAIDRADEKGARPVAVRIAEERVERIEFVPGGHGEQVAHAHGGEVVGDRGRQRFGEERDHAIVDAEEAIMHGEAHGGRGEALAEREEHVRSFGSVGCPPALGNDGAAAQQHEAVQMINFGVDAADEFMNGGRGNAARFGRGAGQELRAGSHDGCMMTENEGERQGGGG